MSEKIPGPETINARFKLGILKINDVEQSVRVDVNCFFYYDPVEPVEFTGGQHVRFENIHKSQVFVPNFDFENEMEEALVTDESYWLDTKTGRVFGRVNWIPHIQERFDHKPFPFDRQIVDVKLFVNNTRLNQWELTDPKRFPVELLMDNPEWISQVELNAVADAWNLKKLETHCTNDDLHKSSEVHFQVFLDREHRYYFWNIAMVYFVIIFLKCVIIAFPYTEERFEYAMTLALTTVAFKFVTSELVPRTSYLTYLDKYSLFGLFLLLIRFMTDLGIQMGMQGLLPFGDNGFSRGECGQENENSLGWTPCSIDFYVTGALGAIWVMAAGIFGLFVLCPNLIRPSWNKLNSRNGNRNKYMQYELTGNKNWAIGESSLQGRKSTRAAAVVVSIDEPTGGPADEPVSL
mmetsp:Transcript_8100/g.10568  ORF Transcript_8100/g.10568 Transcript_8100/m.10568 type:complete len:406 (-) Transcript_8100:1625-2842(-)